jgi:hypothetical protein
MPRAAAGELREGDRDQVDFRVEVDPLGILVNPWRPYSPSAWVSTRAASPRGLDE